MKHHLYPDIMLKEISPYESFTSKLGYSSSRVKQLTRFDCGIAHHGCVNSVKWTRNGEMLMTGSDDRYVKLWKINSEIENMPCAYTIFTRHRGNIFCVDMSPSDPNLIVSCAADGSLLTSYVENKHTGSSLLVSSDIIHMFTFDIDQPNTLYTAEECGSVHRIDLRSNKKDQIFTNNIPLNEVSDNASVPRHSVSIVGSVKSLAQSQFFGGNHLLIGGKGYTLGLLDLRLTNTSRSSSTSEETNAQTIQTSTNNFVKTWNPSYWTEQSNSNRLENKGSPPFIRNNPQGHSNSFSYSVSMSGLLVSKDGRRLLASYQGDQIYTFDTSIAGSRVGPSAIIGGHINYSTFLKSVDFFGPNDEYVLSGSDSGHMWIWKSNPSGCIEREPKVFDGFSGNYSKNYQSPGETRICDVVNVLKADLRTCNGAISHPFLPLIASYGIDSDVKLWGYRVEDETLECEGEHPIDSLNKDNISISNSRIEQNEKTLPGGGSSVLSSLFLPVSASGSTDSNGINSLSSSAVHIGLRTLNNITLCTASALTLALNAAVGVTTESNAQNIIKNEGEEEEDNIVHCSLDNDDEQQFRSPEKLQVKKVTSLTNCTNPSTFPQLWNETLLDRNVRIENNPNVKRSRKFQLNGSNNCRFGGESDRFRFERLSLSKRSNQHSTASFCDMDSLPALLERNKKLAGCKLSDIVDGYLYYSSYHSLSRVGDSNQFNRTVYYIRKTQLSNLLEGLNPQTSVFQSTKSYHLNCNHNQRLRTTYSSLDYGPFFPSDLFYEVFDKCLDDWYFNSFKNSKSFKRSNQNSIKPDLLQLNRMNPTASLLNDCLLFEFLREFLHGHSSTHHSANFNLSLLQFECSIQRSMINFHKLNKKRLQCGMDLIAFLRKKLSPSSKHHKRRISFLTLPLFNLLYVAQVAKTNGNIAYKSEDWKVAHHFYSKAYRYIAYIQELNLNVQISKSKESPKKSGNGNFQRSIFNSSLLFGRMSNSAEDDNDDDDDDNEIEEYDEQDNGSIDLEQRSTEHYESGDEEDELQTDEIRVEERSNRYRRIMELDHAENDEVEYVDDEFEEENFHNALERSVSIDVDTDADDEVASNGKDILLSPSVVDGTEWLDTSEEKAAALTKSIKLGSREVIRMRQNERDFSENSSQYMQESRVAFPYDTTHASCEKTNQTLPCNSNQTLLGDQEYCFRLSADGLNYNDDGRSMVINHNYVYLTTTTQLNDCELGERFISTSYSTPSSSLNDKRDFESIYSVQPMAPFHPYSGIAQPIDTGEFFSNQNNFNPPKKMIALSSDRQGGNIPIKLPSYNTDPNQISISNPALLHYDGTSSQLNSKPSMGERYTPQTWTTSSTPTAILKYSNVACTPGTSSGFTDCERPSFTSSSMTASPSISFSALHLDNKPQFFSESTSTVRKQLMNDSNFSKSLSNQHEEQYEYIPPPLSSAARSSTQEEYLSNGQCARRIREYIYRVICPEMGQAILNNLAATFIQMEKYPDALSVCNEAFDFAKLHNVTEDAKLYFRRGSVHLALKNYELALNDLVEAQKLSPLDASITSKVKDVKKLHETKKKRELRAFGNFFG